MMNLVNDTIIHAIQGIMGIKFFFLILEVALEYTMAMWLCSSHFINYFF